MKSILLALAVLCLASPAFADGRAIDMTVALNDEQGRPAKDVLARDADDATCAHCPVLTLGHAIAHALYAMFPDEKTEPQDQKWARGVLAQRIKDDKAAVLSSEEITVIKRELGKAYGPAILVQAYPLLDPNAKPPQVK